MVCGVTCSSSQSALRDEKRRTDRIRLYLALCIQGALSVRRGEMRARAFNGVSELYQPLHLPTESSLFHCLDEWKCRNRLLPPARRLRSARQIPQDRPCVRSLEPRICTGAAL